MAQDHKLQDNPSTAPAKVAKQDRKSLLSRVSLLARLPLTAAAGSKSAKGPGGIATFALGVNAWALSVGWTLLSPDVSLHQAVIAGTGLWPLLLGTVLHARTHREFWHNAARWFLLCVFPVTLSAALCAGTEASRERTHSAVSMSLAAISLLAYGAAALQFCRLPLPLLATKSHARSSELPRRPDPRWLVKSVATACLGVGSLAIALVAPLTTDYAQLETTWGDAADAGAALTAVVAGAIATTVMGIELGPLLRAQPLPKLSARKRNVRVATMLLLALFSLVTYVIVH